jgi:hypothetical protein
MSELEVALKTQGKYISPVLLELEQSYVTRRAQPSQPSSPRQRFTCLVIEDASLPDAEAKSEPTENERESLYEGAARDWARRDELDTGVFSDVGCLRPPVDIYVISAEEYLKAAPSCYVDPRASCFWVYA